MSWFVNVPGWIVNDPKFRELRNEAVKKKHSH